MSMEKALLAKARPYMLAAKAKEILRREVSKGCLPEILPQSVALTPRKKCLEGEHVATNTGGGEPAIRQVNLEASHVLASYTVYDLGTRMNDFRSVVFPFASLLPVDLTSIQIGRKIGDKHALHSV